MPIENIIENEASSNASANYLERPRLNALFKEAIDYPLVIVCAGSGYGKTRAVHSSLKDYKANISWLQISERDNIPARFWESYSNMVSLLMPNIGSRLKEIGFPNSDEAFLKYSTIWKEISFLPGKHIRVFDDFHLLRNTSVLRFFERKVKIHPPDMSIILISRTMPETNLIGMMMGDNVFTIQEDVLRFTEDETMKFFNQLNLSVIREDIRNIYNDTQGWAFAINLIGHSLAKNLKYERYAFEAMKKNIFRFIETEISQTVSQQLFNFLLRISLIDHLSASLIKVLAKNDSLIKEMELLNAYIRYDFIMDTYMMHHLFHDYLRQKQEQILTDNERREIYHIAGVWCDANGYHMDSLSYYEKSVDYDAITRKVASLNVQMPQDMATYALEIFDRMPDDVKSQNPVFPSMHLKLKINVGHFEEALSLAERYAKDYEQRPETPERNRALTGIYTFWGLLQMKMCTYTDVYDFDFYYKKLSEYFNKNPFKLIGDYKEITANAWASNVGTDRSGAMEEYIAAVSRMSSYYPNTLIGYYDGLEDLIRGELCFYQRQFDDAEQYLKQSITKARKHDQYITQNKALVYIMYIYFSNGDFSKATKTLKEMGTLIIEKDYGLRYTLYDIACGFYHLALDQIEKIPEWLKGDFSVFTHSSFLENYANRIRARYHYRTHQYKALLEYIENSMKHPMILFCKIEMKVLQAMSLYQLKRRSEAISVFTEAYHLSLSNKLITLFTEYAKDMRTLSLAAHKDNTCTIPKKWLEDINRISSIYAKRKIKMISKYMLINNNENKTKLTELEIAVLKDLCDGLVRTAIASNRNLSADAVKIIINNIYDKLGVFSLPEAIRTAMECKII
ncbi:MAG: LuxR C-terminal-related transcriptional regulator [Treponema sp.]|nr:LuxR C-terminal-related transcriptional regulator [Treponema sp.]MCL2251535.1 LuxR C-terminal-related transcriptional regulator [Treponema sp.]